MKVGDWARLDYVTNSQVWEWYEGVCKACSVPLPARIKGGVGKLNQAIKEYGVNREMYEYDTGRRESIDGIQQRVVKIIIAKKEGVDEREAEPREDEDEIPF